MCDIIRCVWCKMLVGLAIGLVVGANIGLVAFSIIGANRHK